MNWSRDNAVTAYLDALTGIQSLAHDLSHDEWALPTDLVGWNVFDNIAHVSALEDELAGRPVPSSISDWSRFPHVGDPFQQYTEVGVEHRRSWTPGELLLELDALVAERSYQLSLLSDSPTADMRGPAGMTMTVDRVMPIRTFDMWAHENDVRRATSREERLSGPAARVSRDRILQSMPIILAREVQAPPGTVVRWVVGEPEPRTVTVRVEEPARGAILPSGDVGADLVLAMDLRTLALLACGRRTPDQVQVSARGDQAFAERVISAMAITP